MNGIQEKQRLGSAQSVSQPIGIMKDNQEMWKDVHDWEGVYMVSSYGQIMSFKCDSSGRILKLTNKKGGYFSFVLKAKGRKNRSCRIHVLVAESFIYKPIGKTQVNHKDCNKQNNHVDNLEWVTPSENMRHAVIMIPSIVSGLHRHNKVLKPQTVLQFTLCGELLGVFPNAREAGRVTGVCARNIHQVASKTEYKPGKIRSQAGGFRWEFKKGTKCNVDPYFNFGNRQQRELLPCI